MVLPYMLKHPQMIYARALSLIHRKKSKKFFDPVPYSISDDRRQRINQYNKENYNVESFYSKQEWERILDRKDEIIFVAGSDIIWQPNTGYPNKYFLDMAYYAGIDCFSYASSLGSDDLPTKYYNAYKRYLGHFKRVSVREERAVKTLEPIINKKVYKVVDPTLLVTVDQWDRFADKAVFEKKPDRDYILCYFVMQDERYWKYVKKMEAECGIQIVVLPMHHLDEKQPYLVIDNGTPYEFLYLIKNATFICTDSFHAAVFSFLYEKEFYILPRSRKAEDSKFRDLLTRYGMMDRVVEDEASFSRNTEISFDKGKTQLFSDRRRSFLYLKEAIEACGGVVDNSILFKGGANV